MNIKVSAIIALSLLAMANAAMVSADPAEIARVVAALNERAVTPALNELTEDGSLFSGMEGAAAWTMGTPGPDELCFIDVAVLGASSATQLQDVVNTLTGDPRIASVTGIMITTVTPTVPELLAFDAVLVYTNSTPQSSVSLGDNLADYVDAGRGVVATMFAVRASVANRTIEGRFLTDNYYCIERSVGSSTTGNATLGTIHVPGHPILDGVATFDGGSSSFRTPAPITANAVRIADWSTGQVLIAERTDLLGGRVDLGFFAVSQLASSGSWLPSTDGGKILRNSVVRASRCDQATSVEPTTWGAIKMQLRD